MKTSRVTSTSSTAQVARSHRMRGAAIVSAVLCIAAAAQPAAAKPCPPGFRGTYPHCMPAQAPQHHQPPYMRTVGAHGGAGVPAGTKHHSYPVDRKIVDSRKIKPVPGAPIERRSGAAASHAIIFVGGRAQRGIDHGNAAINSQPVPPGHSPDTRAINSQPVPPGHSLHRIPQPAAPIEAGGH